MKAPLNDTRLYEAIDKFLAGTQDHPQIAWLKGRYTRLYLRRDVYHALSPEMKIRMLDVANIIVKPAYQGRGVLTNLLAWLEAKNLPLYIENVHDDRLNAFFVRRGYQPRQDIEHCYFRLPRFASLLQC